MRTSGEATSARLPPLPGAGTKLGVTSRAELAEAVGAPPDRGQIGLAQSPSQRLGLVINAGDTMAFTTASVPGAWLVCGKPY